MYVKVLGIDPGTLITGYACIELSLKKLHPIDVGVIRPPKNEKLSTRYHAIFQSISALIERFKPTHIALETPFVQKNAQSAIKLGGAMGCILIAAESHSVEAYGYTPTEVRRGVMGLGSATKEDIQFYLARLLKLDKSSLSKLDATDALAVAVHHVQEFQKKSSIVQAPNYQKTQNANLL